MRKFFSLFAVLLGLVAFMPAISHAEGEESDLSIEAGIDYATKYIWRGVEVNDEPVLQPSFTLGYGDLSFNVWANFDTTRAGDDYPSGGGPMDDNVSEVDYTLDYALPLDNDMVSANIGVIWYVFPAYPGNWDDGDTFEGYASVGFNTILSPTLTVYYDFHEVHGFYGNFSISHSIALTDDEKLSLDMSAAIGAASDNYSNSYYGVDDGIWNDLSGSIGLSYAVTENLSAGVSLNAATMLDGDVKDALRSDERGPGNVWGVCSLSYSF